MGVGSLGELSKPRTFEDETAPAVHAADALKLREVGPPSLLPPSSKSRKRVLASQACARKPSVCSKAKRVLESQACARKSSVRSKVKRVLESQACARKSSVRCINARWCFSHGVPRDGAPAHLHRPPSPPDGAGPKYTFDKSQLHAPQVARGVVANAFHLGAAPLLGYPPSPTVSPLPLALLYSDALSNASPSSSSSSSYPPPPPPPFLYCLDTSRPSPRTNWTRLVLRCCALRRRARGRARRAPRAAMAAGRRRGRGARPGRGGAGTGAPSARRPGAAPPPPLPLVVIGHAASLTPY